MGKRIVSFLLALALSFALTFPALACNESQTDNYVLQILYGNNASVHESDPKAKALQDALYLCSMQSNGQGSDKLLNLKKEKVFGVPSLSNIDIKAGKLSHCSHKSWEYEYPAEKKKQAARKNILRNTVNKVYDFGFFNSLFGVNDGKCNSLAAVLYYTHILADYIADDPEETETYVKGYYIPSYSGSPYTTINGNKPSFTKDQKNNTRPFSLFSEPDGQGRCGFAFANIGPENIVPPATPRNMPNVSPSGWNQNSYINYIYNSSNGQIFERCHLIAHELLGNDDRNNLITGTSYMNKEGMKPFEDEVTKYIRETKNHVLYRATPIYQGGNMLASGVQLEAYSIEDNGKKSFNIYCYNVQPGISINYKTGMNELADNAYSDKDTIPFAILNPSDNNPDLMFEMDKHLKILFEDQKNESSYLSMMRSISEIASEARNGSTSGDDPAKKYKYIKDCEYKYFNVLKENIPKLLEKEEFFKKGSER